MISIPNVIDLKLYDDDRGFLVPLTNNLSPEHFKRVYVCGNNAKGVIRGFHLHEKEWKYFYIIKGAAKFIAINPEDIADIYDFVITDRKPKLVIIPPGYANGWISLQDETLLVVLSSRTIEELEEDNDERIDPFKWGKEMWEVEAR